METYISLKLLPKMSLIFDSSTFNINKIFDLSKKFALPNNLCFNRKTTVYSSIVSSVFFTSNFTFTALL